MNTYLTVTDQFCGAGGSSQGGRNIAQKMGGGIEVKMALNHWKLAIETHNANFPDTSHFMVPVLENAIEKHGWHYHEIDQPLGVAPGKRKTEILVRNYPLPKQTSLL